MVQQLSLTAQVPSTKINRLLLTLKTLTGNIQSEMNQHSVILKPRYPFTPEIIPGKVMQIESYRIRMNRIWERKNNSIITFSDLINSLNNEKLIEIKGDSITKQDSNGLNSSIWTLQLSDIPAGGKTSVSIQNIYETTIYQTDDVIGYLDELGYMHETEFWNNGIRFYYNNVIIEIYQLYTLDDEKNNNVIIDADSEMINDDPTQSTSNNKDPKNDSSSLHLKLLDPSGTCFLKSYVNVGSLNDIESVSLGTRQLETLKKELSELVELHVPDRTAMDSRINSRIASSNR